MEPPVFQFQLSPFVIAFHCVLVPLKVISVSLVQFWNADALIVVKLAGKITLSSEEQLIKALSPILVTPSEIVTVAIL